MNRYGLSIAIAVVALVALVGATGAATAQPGNGAQAQADGPPSALPDPVPDFVTELLGTIGDFVDGAVTALGEAVRSITPGTIDVPPVDT